MSSQDTTLLLLKSDWSAVDPDEDTHELVVKLLPRRIKAPAVTALFLEQGIVIANLRFLRKRHNDNSTSVVFSVAGNVVQRAIDLNGSIFIQKKPLIIESYAYL